MFKYSLSIFFIKNFQRFIYPVFFLVIFFNFIFYRFNPVLNINCFFYGRTVRFFILNLFINNLNYLIKLTFLFF